MDIAEDSDVSRKELVDSNKNAQKTITEELDKLNLEATSAADASEPIYDAFDLEDIKSLSPEPSPVASPKVLSKSTGNLYSAEGSHHPHFMQSTTSSIRASDDSSLDPKGFYVEEDTGKIYPYFLKPNMGVEDFEPHLKERKGFSASMPNLNLDLPIRPPPPLELIVVVKNEQPPRVPRQEVLPDEDEHLSNRELRRMELRDNPRGNIIEVMDNDSDFGGFLESLIDPRCDLGYGVVLMVVAIAQLVGRELGISARVLGVIGAVVHVVSIVVPIVHGAFVVWESRKDGSSVGEALRSNWGVVACMVPLLASLRDFASMRGTDVEVDGERMAVGGHGVLAAMAVAMVCAQGVGADGQPMSMAQVWAFVAGDVVVVSAYVARWLVPVVGDKYHVVPLAYVVLAAAVLGAALGGKRLMARSSGKGWQRAMSVAVPLVNAVLVGVGCGYKPAHMMRYVVPEAKEIDEVPIQQQ